MRLTWLPDVLRAAGLTVHTASGWAERGSSSWGPIEGITIHETRGSRTSTDAGEIRVLINGSTSAPPPIAQLYLSRSGEWWVIASGRCNHNLVGWAGPNKGLGNSRLLGIEAQHAAGEPWTARQYNSYVRGVAALVRHLRIPVGRVAGHKEHQPWPAPKGQTSTKSDPEFDMAKFRRDVAAVVAGKDDDVSAEEVFDYKIPNDYTKTNVEFRTFIRSFNNSLARLEIGMRQALKTSQAALAAATGVDDDGIKALIQQTAEAETKRDAELAELVRQVDSGERDAAEVVRLIGEKLAADTAPQG